MTLLIYVLALALVFWLLNSIVATIPMAEPARQVCSVVIAIIFVMLLFSLLLGGPGRLPLLGRGWT